MITFDKAFDTVRHSTMTTKLAKLNIPDEIYNWVVNFLKERGHMTKYAGRTSAILYVNGSIVSSVVSEDTVSLYMQPWPYAGSQSSI